MKFNFILALGLLASSLTLAQPIYNLTGDLTVDDCEGFFLDSDEGQMFPNGQGYTHGEDYIFTICVPDAEYIELFFSEFNTEFGLDVLTIYDGPDVNSPVIGSYSGVGMLPPAAVSTGNCITIHWTSDVDGVSGTGWNAFWQAEVIEPTPPVVNFSPVAPTCSTSTVQMIFDIPIDCDSVYPGAILFTGEINQTVTSVTPLDCNGGEATTFEIDLAPGLDESGGYHLDYTYYYTDDCENLFELDVDGDFVVSDCPLDVDLFLDANSICEGECTEIWAEVTGGDPNTYNFVWVPALPNNAGPHQVCPTSTQVYTLTVSDAAGSTPSTESITLTVVSAPTLAPAGPVCEQDPPFALTANPSGGTWYGDHIDDDDQLFHPDSGEGLPWSYYQSPQGCWDSLQIQVTEIDPGLDQASCVGAPPFMIPNFSPPGGTWSGPSITPAGQFNPSSQGTFTVTYTAPNGCSAAIDVNVGPIVIDPVGPVCQSDDPFFLTATPFGGTWSGTGIVNSYWGAFDPDIAGGGIHTLTYTVNGCSETIDVDVTTINAYWDFSACPFEAPFQLTGNPAGGTWSGIGVSPSGLYDPSGIANGVNDTLTYSVNGCTDTRIAFVRITTIVPTQAEFCTYDDALTLDWWGIQRYPGGGTWTGPGTDNVSPGHFTPSVAGPGNHMIYYDVNNCTDSVLMIVHANNMQDTTICEQADPFNLMALPIGGSWFGDDVIDQNAGTFDPQSAGIGLHWAYYQSLAGCWDSLTVDVYELEPAGIAGLQSNYCYVDSMIDLLGTPIGGVFSGDGMSDSIFNPLIAGPGLHQITYLHGTGECAVQTTEMVSVSQPITSVPFPAMLICNGDEALVGVEAAGGSGSNFSYVWEPNITWLNETPVFPDTSTTYMVEVNDGCSQPDTAYVQVDVEPEIQLSVTTSEPQCQGALGNASITAGPGSNYEIVWNVDPPTTGTSLLAPVAHSYSVTITEPISGCSKDTTVFIPSYPNVTAYFTQNPNIGCIGESDPTAQFLDLSEGGVNGTWDFGDGTSEAYEFGVYPQHTYADTGRYPVVLYIENEMGTCTDSFEFVVCIQPEFRLWIPTAFTPNGDGLNDVFEIESSGVIEFELEILSRWGHEIYRMSSLEDPWWDGTFKGELLPEDYYTWSVVVKARHLGGFLHEKNSGQVMLLRTQ